MLKVETLCGKYIVVCCVRPEVIHFKGTKRYQIVECGFSNVRNVMMDLGMNCKSIWGNLYRE